MQLDTIFGTGGLHTLHLGEAVSLGGDGGVGQFCSAVFILEVLTADRAVVVQHDTIFGTGGFRTVHLGEGVSLGRDGGVVQLRGAVFVLKVLAADRAVVMRLDTIFGTGGFRTVHLGEAVPLGWDGGVVQLRGAVFVLEVLAADRAVEMFQETLVRTGGLLTLHLGEFVVQSIHIRLLHNHIAAPGTDLSLGQAGCRTGGGSGKNRLRMLGGISRNLLEGQRAIGHSFLSQHIGFGTQVPYHRHVHRITRITTSKG